MRELPALERLQELFHYNPETGILTRLKSVRGMGAVGVAVGTPNSDGHLVVRVDRQICYIHRIGWKLFYQQEPSKIVDHKNRCRNDNRIKNLRLADNYQSSRNRNLGKNNTTGIAGVYYRPLLPYNKWKAAIKVNGTTKHLGYFRTKEEAMAARHRAQAKYHKEYAGA